MLYCTTLLSKEISIAGNVGLKSKKGGGGGNNLMMGIHFETGDELKVLCIAICQRSTLARSYAVMSVAV